ncbi:MAG: hypothetical protein DI537_10275 [Stutzerimonas stutzeri]|nr:MAG: hypothetical protein DI537_10275 [Stutzerimonas stutzeri]
MTVHPLTKITNWYVGHLHRNRREWVSAFCAFSFWDRSLGLWNLAILAIAIGIAKASRMPAVKRAAVRFVNWYLDQYTAWHRRFVICRGLSAMIRRFPASSELGHLLARVVVRDQNGRPLYDLRILAHPDGAVASRLLVTAIALNIVHPEDYLTGQMLLECDHEFRVRCRVKVFDPNAFRVADEFVDIDLPSGLTSSSEYRTTVKYRDPEPDHLKTIRNAIDGIVEEPLRTAARAALEDSHIGALRRNLGRVLHPDRTASPSASAALATINSALDEAQA